MNPHLVKFLESEDLDDALKVLRNLGQLGEDDRMHIQQILLDWSPPQALANILIHTMIPAEQRLDYLLKGLRETNIPYLVLASTVGFQNISIEFVTEGQRQLIVDELFTVMERYPPFAGRATQSIRSFLTKNDASRMFRLLDILQDASLHNALAWLITEIADKNSDEFLLLATESGASPETIQFAKDKLEEYNRAKANKEFTNLGFSLLSYIPNLKDMIAT